MPVIPVQTAFRLAVQHQTAGRLAEAEAIYRQILAVEPNHAAAYSNLGEAYRVTNRFAEAVDVFQRAIHLNPNLAEAHYNLGLALVGLERKDEALAEFRQALKIKPNYAEAHNNLGNVLKEQDRPEEAEAAFRRTLEIKPDYAPAHNNLGNLLGDEGQFESAMAEYQRALELDPTYVEACNNLGRTLVELRRFDEARVALARALALRPNYPVAKFNAAFLALLHGDYERGWHWYESRWEVPPVKMPPYSQPLWKGEPLDGKRILIHAEQGFGDSLHFIRYAALVAARGGEVIVGCQPALERLFRTAAGVKAVITDGNNPGEFDVQIPMLSQPLVFQTRLESIPRDIPYLFADPAQVECWRKRLGERRSPLRVGLAWAGDLQHRRNRKRSIALQMLQPLWRLEGIEFFSLQIGPEAAQLAELSTAPIVDHTSLIADFADTAAFMAELDLVITVDTAVAHLAGALGRPVWTLLSFVPDWRWGLEGEDTPWYPTMRLFRQPALCDWESVIQRVEAELGRLRETAGAGRIG
ncbi:MAG TPA: tetratricopeptide repeat protein [Chthoniobacter sp.]|jgi:tetratricopeptide (TPR) repeat protein